MVKLNFPVGDHLPLIMKVDMIKYGYNPGSRESVGQYFRDTFQITEDTPEAKNCIKDTIRGFRRRKVGGLEPLSLAKW